MASRTPNPSLVRERRLQRGLTQAQLAARAGVSRQLVAAVEAGHNTPGVDAAIALARALGTAVEELFSGTTTVIRPALGGRLRAGTPVKVGRVGDCLVAAELADHGAAGAAWAAPDAIVRHDGVALLPGTAPAGIVLAGCEPALGVAEAMLQGLGQRSLLALSASTGRALRALGEDTVHGAVVHGPEGGLPDAPVRVCRLQLARWQVGLGLAPGMRHTSMEGVLGARTPIAQRDGAAASQQALTRAARRLGFEEPLPGAQAAGHLDAARLAATLGCAAVTTEAAARAFGLRFIGLETHTVQVWVAERWTQYAAAEAFGALLASAAFIERVATFGGYDLTGCGSRVG